MSFLGFGGNYNRPGPGIPKDIAKKKGAPLFFEILGREFWALLTLNLIYVLACLPIVTIGPATAALSRVTVTMIRDENVYPWRDFWDAFRKNIKQGLIFGLPATLFAVMAVYLNLIVLTTASGALWTAFIFVWTFVCLGIGCYIFPLVAYVDLPTVPLFKNAFFLFVLGKFRTVASVLVTIAATVLCVLYFPLSPIFMVIFGYFAFLSFFNSFMIWSVIDQYVIRKFEAAEFPQE